MVYRFKICFEDYEEIYREIEIKSTQHFEDFHNAIQKAVNFDNTHPASFYISDDHWRKGTEIALKNLNEQAAPQKLMNKCKLASYIEDPHQKMVYVSDFSAMWTFYVELLKILPEDPKATYPNIVKTVGAAKRQYKTQIIAPIIVEDEDLDASVDMASEKIFQPEEGYDEIDSDEDGLIDEDPEERMEGEEEEQESEFHESETDEE